MACLPTKVFFAIMILMCIAATSEARKPFMLEKENELSMDKSHKTLPHLAFNLKDVGVLHSVLSGGGIGHGKHDIFLFHKWEY